MSHRLKLLLNGRVDWLAADASTLALGDVEVDTDHFVRLVASQHLSDWQAAVDLYTGDLLETLDHEWVRRPRAELRERYLQVLPRICTALAGQGKLDDALRYAYRWVEADQLNEEAHSRVITLLAQMGRTIEALRQYDTLVALLREELSSPPLDETQSLAEAIRAGRHTSRQAAAAQAESRAGQRRIRPRVLDDDVAKTIPVVLAVALVQADAPHGHSPDSQKRTTVYWTVDAGAADAAIRQLAGKVLLRRHRIARLRAEAELQGARATDRDLASALGVSERTIQADRAVMRGEAIGDWKPEINL
jgi:DNA-binding SARP family transcriptional activator